MADERLVSLEGCDLSHIYYTTNSSCSDIISPITPTFSGRSHLRYSSSSSSLELLPPSQDGPASPSPSNTKTSLRQLPDVQEEPLERDDDQDSLGDDHFGLYSCLCDQACEHQASSHPVVNDESVHDFGIDYDLGFLSDTDLTSDLCKKKRATTDTLGSLTSRISVRIPSISRWRSLRQTASANVMSSPTYERSLENFPSARVVSACISSRSSSTSSPSRRFPVILSEGSMFPSLAKVSNMSVESLQGGVEPDLEGGCSVERDRAMATTPLLPPLMTDPLGRPPQISPLQSPSIASTSPATNVSPRLQGVSLSARPSRTSLQMTPGMAEPPLLLPPSILQEQDEWSDRLGHANFTIMPVPYELAIFNLETVTRFLDDWDAARVNYTKHLVRTGENYGHTSKIYGLTEAKWAETERRWRATYEDILRQTEQAAPSVMLSRGRSRGRRRGRADATLSTGSRDQLSNDDVLAAVQWRQLEACIPSAVPQLLEALDADGKFPYRGDEEIVGPMQRDAYMIRARSEENKMPRFWRSLTEKLRR